jgi:DNA polymerase-3 subunit epsilon
MKLFYADTETTGLDPQRNEIFQLAYIIEVDGEIVCERNILMRPERTDCISPEALQITGKSREEILGYPPKSEGFKLFIKDLAAHVDRFKKADKMVWIGQNPDFDVRFVRTLFREMEDKFFGSWFAGRPADLITLAIACKIKGLINPPNFKLGSLAEAFNITFDAHDALADVRVTRDIWEKLSANLGPTPAKAQKPQLELGL